MNYQKVMNWKKNMMNFCRMTFGIPAVIDRCDYQQRSDSDGNAADINALIINKMLKTLDLFFYLNFFTRVF